MYYMITATFKGDDVKDIIKQAKEHFLRPPDGIERIDTWIGMKGRRCFQVLRTDNESLLQRWTMQFRDLFDVEVDPVDHNPSSETDCNIQNLERLAHACRMYADDHDGMLPSAMAALQRYAGEPYDPDAYVLLASGDVLEIENTKDSSKEVLILRKEPLQAVAFVDGHAEIVAIQ